MAATQEHNGTRATINNKTHFEMTLDRSQNWSGVPATTFPKTILPNSSVIFNHLNEDNRGSKGAVVYTGRNAVGMYCSWVLGWHAPADDQSPSTTNTVYSVCGPKMAIDKLTFDEILKEIDDLDNALPSDTHTDPATKTYADGNIHDLVPKLATLNSDFKLVR